MRLITYPHLLPTPGTVSRLFIHRVVERVAASVLVPWQPGAGTPPEVPIGVARVVAVEPLAGAGVGRDALQAAVGLGPGVGVGSAVGR